MAQITESFDVFLHRVSRRLVLRLLLEEADEAPPDAEIDEHEELLAKIRMANRIRQALDQHIHELIVYGNDQPNAVLNEALGGSSTRPTWKEIGIALGVSAQAANRKYGNAVRHRMNDPGNLEPR